MKTLQVPFHFFPEAVGGTEIYALALAHRLRNAGHDVEFAAPGETRTSYTHEGFPVHRFAVTPVTDVAQFYDQGDIAAADEFDQIVCQIRPDVIHLHALTHAVSLRLVRKARQRKIPVVLTAHVPAVFCPRKTMMRYGTQVCDGAVEMHKCSRCMLQSRGLPKPLAQMIGSLPPGLGSAMAFVRRNGWTTAFRMTQLIGMQRAVFTEIVEETSHIVAVSEWVRQGLLDNGAPASRLSLCRQGLTYPAASSATENHRPDQVRRIVYLGRLHDTKGVHVLIEAIRRVPGLPVHLDVYGIGDNAERQRLAALAGKDERIRFVAPVPNREVVATIRAYDAVAIPSIWLETGPLVVFDAFAAGVPVIGSRRGGIAELVTHEQDGLLVEAGNPSAWSAALERICSEDGLLEKLRRGIRPPRTMDTVAGEMLQLYQRLAS